MGDLHPYWCDCAGCWTGITRIAGLPSTRLQRVIDATKAKIAACFPADQPKIKARLKDRHHD